MPRSLVVGPSSFETCASIARAFGRVGWQADAAMFDLGQSRPKYWMRRLARYTGNLERFEQAIFNRLLRTSVLPHIWQERPDVVLFVKPFGFSPRDREELRRSGARVAIWATDSLSRLRSQACLRMIAEQSYMMDGGDVSGRGSAWLPLGFDDQIFRPLEDRPLWDVLFVGNIFRVGYETRKQFFEKLRFSVLGRKCRIGYVGSLPSRLANRTRHLHGTVHWISTGLPIRQLARVVASSSICVNVHQDEGHQPVNPMVFAIGGCRSCLVTDRRRYLGHWTGPEDAYIAASADDLVPTLEKLLASPDRVEVIAASGYRSALNHTFVRRVQRILGDMGFGSYP